MRRRKVCVHVSGFTLVELLVVVGIIGLLAAILVPTLTKAKEIANQTVCMGNLSGIGKGIGLYKNQYDNKWPWVDNPKGWSSSSDTFFGIPTGDEKLRKKEIEIDPNKPQDPRSITTLMWLLVRDGQNAGMFVCPSDKSASPETDIKWDHDGKDDTEDVYYWDFSSETHVSYSWQAPIVKNDKLVQGISDAENESLVMADKTPRCDDENWNPVPMQDSGMKEEEIRANNSQNHDGGRKLMAMQVGLNVIKRDRCDIGPNKDNIYTCSGDKKKGSQKATDFKSVSRHFTERDTFLTGPVPTGGWGSSK